MFKKQVTNLKLHFLRNMYAEKEICEKIISSENNRYFYLPTYMYFSKFFNMISI